MAQGIKVNVGTNVGFCSTDLAEGEECGVAEATGGFSGALVSPSTGTALIGKGDVYIGAAGGIEPGPTGVAPVQFTPRGGSVYRSNIGFTFVPIVLQYKWANGEIKGKMAGGRVIPAFTVKEEGLGKKGDPDGETYFVPYFNAGSIPVEPSRDGLTPPGHPFAGVPIGGDVPALLAVRVGLRNIPVGEYLPVNIEFGKGIEGGRGFGVLGDKVSSTGWSLLVSGRVNELISDWVGLRWGIQKTVKDAPEEPELNQFLEGEGETEIWPAWYLVFELGIAQLYFGSIEKRIHIAQYPSGDSANPIADVDRFRRYRYVAVEKQLPGEINAVFTYGVETFIEEDPENLRARVDGSLTSLKLSREFGLPDGWGTCSVDGTFFVQTASGDKAGEGAVVPGPGELLPLEPVSERSSGGLLTLSWSWEREHKR